MVQVKVRLNIWSLAGKQTIEGVALLCDTNADTLRLVVETIAVDNHYDIDFVGWECYFYHDDEEGMLAAYISDVKDMDSSPLKPASVLRLH